MCRLAEVAAWTSAKIRQLSPTIDEATTITSVDLKARLHVSQNLPVRQHGTSEAAFHELAKRN